VFAPLAADGSVLAVPFTGKRFQFALKPQGR
jgi:hypothetical protein